MEIDKEYEMLYGMPKDVNQLATGTTTKTMNINRTVPPKTLGCKNLLNTCIILNCSNRLRKR